MCGELHVQRHTAVGAGEKSRRIRELTSIVQKRFGFADGAVELYAEKVMNRGLCAVAQAESLRYKLLGGLAVRRCVTAASCVHRMRSPDEVYCVRECIRMELTGSFSVLVTLITGDGH